MTRKLQLFSLLGLLFVADGLRASATCVAFFANANGRELQAGTDDLIAYLATLLEQQIIGEAELRRIIAGGEAGEFANPITEQQASVNTAALLHRNEIQEYLDTTELDLDEILPWTKQKLLAMQGVKVRRDETREDTANVIQRMEFYPIAPGKLKTERVLLTHEIEMMSTLVTQRHWIELMGKNPSQFKGLDHPVENVTWWSAITFANRLSIKHGYKPAYDLSGISIFEGTAEDGTLSAVDQFAPKIKAPKGDIYLAQGYRLPTTAEHQYVRENFSFAMDDKAQLGKHAWTRENSFGSTHPVGELKAVMIGGKSFYDLLGNVSEWAHDWDDWNRGEPCKNPCGDLSLSKARSGAGGCWFYSSNYCANDSYVTQASVARLPYYGFRLVRTIR